MDSIINRIKKSPALPGLILLIIAIILNIIIQSKSFFSPTNINTLLAKNMPLVLTAMAQCVVMLVGCIDLSIGYQLSLANVIAIMAPEVLGWPIWFSWLMGALAVMIASSINGLVVGYLRIPPLLATFSMGYIIRGINVIIMPKPQGTIPKAIYKLYDGKVLGMPFSLGLLIILMLIWHIIKKYPLGKHLLAVGGNERNAYASGLNISQVRLKAYMISGFIAAFAGLSLTAMAASGNPLMGDSYTLRSVAACVLGGISMSGGWGSMFGAIFGSFFLSIVQNTVFFLFSWLSATVPGFQLSSYYQNLVSDIIILVGLTAAVFTSKSNYVQVKKVIDVRPPKKNLDNDISNNAKKSMKGDGKNAK